MKHVSSSALLISGTEKATTEYALKTLQETFCTTQGCNQCTDCQMIKMGTHHHILWITPEKKYTLETLEPIAETIGFALDHGQYFFFVLNKAHLLTDACANSLLKMVEEPPTGYHFLFLATQTQQVLPTIRSRCQLVYAHDDQTSVVPHFLQHFIKPSSSAVLFTKDLAQSPEDHEVPAHLDLLLQHWITTFHQALLAQDVMLQTLSKRMITLVQQAALVPPMPGSAKIFWKNLFLQKEQELFRDNT